MVAATIDCSGRILPVFRTDSSNLEPCEEACASAGDFTILETVPCSGLFCTRFWDLKYILWSLDAWLWPCCRGRCDNWSSETIIICSRLSQSRQPVLCVHRGSYCSSVGWKGMDIVIRWWHFGASRRKIKIKAKSLISCKANLIAPLCIVIFRTLVQLRKATVIWFSLNYLSINTGKSDFVALRWRNCE